MFIADSNQILRAHMDGTNVKSIVTEAVYKASGIALDGFTKRVFWCDSLLDYIETVDYNGNNHFLILRGMCEYYAFSELNLIVKEFVDDFIH